MGLLRADLLKLARHALPRWLFVALLSLALLRGLVWPPDPDLPWRGLWSTGLVVTAVVMLTAVSVGLEFDEGTFRAMTSRGVPRWAFLLSKFTALVIIGGVLLGLIEGLATLLGVRPELRWGEVWRAWLVLCPYIALIMLLTVLARNGGLALVVGVIWIVLEQLLVGLVGPFALLPDMPQFRFLTPDGFLGAVLEWTLSFHGANWTYLADWQRAPTGINALMWAVPWPALYSGLLLAVYTLLGLGLAILIICRRDVTEVAERKRDLSAFAKRRHYSKAQRVLVRPVRVPALMGKGPVLFRLVRAHLFKAGRTSLVKVGLAVSLLFPLTLWGVSRAMKAAGLQDYLFGAGPDGGTPLAIVIVLLVVGPLATVIAALAVSNELSLGTRRGELTRGITRAQTIIAQSLALMLTTGVVFGLVIVVILIMAVSISGAWPLYGAALTVLVAVLSAGAYIGAVQLGGALTQSPVGAILFGLGFLLADWFGILAPTVTIDDPGPLLDAGRYAVFANTFVLAGGDQIAGVTFEWPHFRPPVAVLLLLGYAIASHALAALVANWRDA